MKKKYIVIILILMIFSIAVFLNLRKKTPDIFVKDDIKYTSKISGNTFQVYCDGEWKDIVIKGVNIGITKPGKWPGETGITEEEYYRWFEKIGEMNANAIRVYTINPPGFYTALEKYNRTHENPLYLFHGVWIEEENLEKTLDAFSPDNTEPFKKDISKVIDVIHGNITISEKPGHASGEYTADVSPYLAGWILGIEWYPYMVENTNIVHKDIGEYNGKYVYTQEAKPFEHWLGSIFDYTLSYEMDKYKWQHPISFTNWVTTDLLSHPYEPLEQEDLVSVDPNVIKLKNIETGQFASYHIYPYYPDFLNYDPKYTQYIDHRGKPNNYAGYLKNLKSQHNMPMLVAEFGIPSSRGMTHKNVYGWNQGFISEEEQGKIVSDRFEDIIQEGYLGGLVFSWQDEWFKRTWNTMDFDNPDRRPYWSNAQTCEQQFGLLSFDRLKIKIDGDKNDWKKLKSKPIYEKGNKFIEKVYIDHDERYLYLAIKYKESNQNVETKILLDTIPGQGNTIMPFNKNIQTDSGIDFIIQLSSSEDSKVLVDSYYDTFYYQYSHLLKMYPENTSFEKKDNGFFNPIRLVLNRGITIPATGETLPLEYYETGILKEGNGNPEKEDYDSLVDYCINKKDNFVEIRIPWFLMNFKDPSTKEVMGDFWKGGLESSINIDGINIGIVAYDKNQTDNFDSFPKISSGKIPKKNMYLYTWDEWNEPQYSERLKKSYYILKETFKKY